MSFVTVAIAGASALGQIQSGRTAKAQAGLQAQALEAQGRQEEQAALETARVIRRAGHKVQSAATAAYAGAGVRVDSGSAQAVQEQIGQDVEHDAFQTILEGKRRALGLGTEASLRRTDGMLAQSAAYVNAAGTVLGGAYKGMVANGWRSGGGPGFSGTQAAAPVTDRSTYRGVR